jgi:hypothetical protein
LSKRFDLVGQRFGRLVVERWNGLVRRRSHYDCLCDCGRRVLVDGSKLRAEHTRSCGCLRSDLSVVRNQRFRKAPGESLRNRVIWQYRANAKSRGLVFNLSLEDLTLLFAGNCFYCGRPPSTLVERPMCFGPFIYNGIDRFVNELGYTPENCVSCCPECNYRKAEANGIDFIEWARRVAGYAPSGSDLAGRVILETKRA